MNTSHKPTLILIVEDDDDDFFLAEKSLRKSGIASEIVRTSDGDETLDYLFAQGKFTNSPPLPDIILLDLNLPGTSGKEVLEKVKLDNRLKCIPVIVITTSDDERDIDSCYKLGANSFMQKPIELQEYIVAINRLKDYWFDIVLVPKTKRES